MKVLKILSLLGMLALAMCESEESELEGAGTMPPEPAEPIPPGISGSDDKRSGEQDLRSRSPIKNIRDKQRGSLDMDDADKRSDTSEDKQAQDLDLRLRELIKNILQERRENGPSKREKKDIANNNEQITSEKRGNRRKQKNLTERSLEGLEAAKKLEISGKETATKCTDQQKIDTVNVHQKFRMMEPGANIWKMGWDDSLARLAQALADTCVFKHTNLNFANGTRVGQNLAVIKGNNHTIEKVVQLFYNEKSFYDINDHSFEDFSLVGHYLQLEYWDTVKVGCGIQLCPTLYLPDRDDVWENAYYWACDYWPPLHSKTRPYQIGEPCTECVVPAGKGIGWMCVDNTCEECNVGDPGCNEPGPCTTFDPDVKSEKICNKVKAHKYCNKGTPGYKYAKLYCRTTCQFCRGIPEAIDTSK